MDGGESLNWRGRPLTNHHVILQSIAATTTDTGLSAHAQLDTGTYPTGVQFSDADMAALPVTRHAFHSDWSNTLRPDRTVTTPEPAAAPATTVVDRHLLAGWSEVNIVVRFWTIAGVCVAAGLGLFYSDFLAAAG